MAFKPGTDTLTCPYCGQLNAIDASTEAVEELDYLAMLSDLGNHAETVEVLTVRCESCAAEVNAPPGATAFDCPFCGHAINAQAKSRRLIKPRSLLPFSIDRPHAREAFKNWLKSRWFLPTKLQKFGKQDSKLTGVYLPYWTYDSKTTSRYTGQRGEHYWETQTYTTRENGKTVTKTRRVRKTRWYSVSGRVYVPFDDVLVLASHALPAKLTQKLEPWDLHALVPFDAAYLAGFRGEAYQVGLEQGFNDACQVMEQGIRTEVRRDIGGDEQRIHSLHTRHDDITFKHILLPIWISAYRFNGKVYRFLINGRTGEVQGERPYSAWKILGAVLLGMVVAAAISGMYVLTQS